MKGYGYGRIQCLNSLSAKVPFGTVNGAMNSTARTGGTVSIAFRPRSLSGLGISWRQFFPARNSLNSLSAKVPFGTLKGFYNQHGPIKGLSQ